MAPTAHLPIYKGELGVSHTGAACLRHLLHPFVPAAAHAMEAVAAHEGAVAIEGGRESRSAGRTVGIRPDSLDPEPPGWEGWGNRSHCSSWRARVRHEARRVTS